MRQSSVAQHEVARAQLAFLAAMIEGARPLRLQQEVVMARRAAFDVALLAFDAAGLDCQTGELDRPELVDPQGRVELVLVARREFDLAHA
ncbi:MAG: hypothetical protein B7Y88_11405 [Sphingomonadales bacterium 32-64-17]|nr:MAG: hypothetical protein B7Y88_11405 [Sphingomonadales bacterium 32-64-17]